jgi:DNA ligase (NAD+)
MNRIKELENLIDINNEKYWNEEKEIEVSDPTFDNWMRELKILDPENSRVLNFYNIIGSKTRKKVKHTIPMLSLDKVYSIDELIKWCSKVARSENELFSIQPKLDGISADFTNGVLSTRGDGASGVDLSDKIPFINVEIDEHLRQLKDIEIDFRGEIIIRKSVFQENKYRLLRKDGKPYKIERGAVVGLTLQDEIDSSLIDILSLISFDKYSMVHPLSMLKKMSWEYLIDDVKSWDFPTDGLVIKLHDQDYALTLGATGHHVKHQMALKYTNPSAETTLIDVIWQVGKNSITPVGVVKPIVLAGAEIRRVSLHNSKFIIDRDIHINDTVTIERSGEIIPHVVSVTATKNRKKIIINKCPKCGYNVTYIEPDLICTNYKCEGKLLRNILDGVKRIGLENLGEPTIEKMIETLGIQDLADVLNLTKIDISQIEGFATVSIDNLYNEIQRIRNTSIEDWKFLASINIKGIGLSLSRQLMEQLTLEELYNADATKLNDLRNIGMGRAIELKTGIFKNKNEIIKLIKILKIKQTKGGVLKQPICFTGKSDKPRNYWKELAEEKGYVMNNTVTKNTTYLVTNDTNSNSSKMNKAHKHGIKIISYEDFANL